jgi:hypothetical protein
MNKPHAVFITGEPFGKPYQGKRKDEPAKWDAKIQAATLNWPKVDNACLLRVSFLLPPDKFADPALLGPDLDNLLKRFLDALKTTVFAKPSDDSFVVSIEAAKTRVGSISEAGAQLEIVPLMTVVRKS